VKIGDGLDEQIAEYEKAKGSGDDARTTEYDIEAPKHAYANAGHFLAAEHVEDGVTLLRYHQGVFYRWRKEVGYYVAFDDKALRDEVYQFFDHKAYAGARGDTLIFGADSTNVNKVIDALASRTLIAKDTEPPAWLDQAEHPPASELVVTENGILHLPKRVLLRHTPELFATHRLAFAYDPKAPKPREWLAFLESLKIGKKGIDFLHEILGYILSGDTSLHKIFLIVGPPRSGKGTIGRVLGALIGTHNLTSPTLAQLSETFGLEDLIGKPLAIVADARLAGRSDKTVIIERLLSISGEDHQTINRKYMKAWNGKLAVRFLILTNEIPSLYETSGAFAGRMVPIQLTESFYGHEDTALTARLYGELPGIFNLALDGYQRVRERRSFELPTSSSRLFDEISALTSPLRAFVEENGCPIGPEHEAPCDELRRLYQAWRAKRGGKYEPDERTFGRDLYSAFPHVQRVRRGPKGKQTYYYSGIGLPQDHRADYEKRLVEERLIAAKSTAEMYVRLVEDDEAHKDAKLIEDATAAAKALQAELKRVKKLASSPR